MDPRLTVDAVNDSLFCGTEIGTASLVNLGALKERRAELWEIVRGNDIELEDEALRNEGSVMVESGDWSAASNSVGSETEDA